MEEDNSPVASSEGPFSSNTDDILFNFNKLSLNEIEIDIKTLEQVILRMKEESIQTIPLSKLLFQLGVESPRSAPPSPKKSPNHIFESNTPPQTPSSISSSINSSWSAASFQASPIHFNFQTPQKIFSFEPKKTPKVEEQIPGVVPPVIDPPGKGVSKSLFFDAGCGEGGEETKSPPLEPTQPSLIPKTETTTAPAFSLGAPPSNKTSKLAKRGSAKKAADGAAVKQKFGSTVFGSNTQTAHPQQPQQPFSFGSFVPELAKPSSRLEDEGQSPPATDDDMEIGQGDEALPHPASTAGPTPPLWKIPTTTSSHPFGSQPELPPSSVDTDGDGNPPQVPKKKVTSALKRRLKGSKKVSGKEDMSKLDNIFANISLKPTFQHDENPESGTDEQAEKAPFIFFPPPQPNPEQVCEPLLLLSPLGVISSPCRPREKLTEQRINLLQMALAPVRVGKRERTLLTRARSKWLRSLSERAKTCTLFRDTTCEFPASFLRQPVDASIGPFTPSQSVSKPPLPIGRIDLTSFPIVLLHSS
jgi:hypothetical protein